MDRERKHVIRVFVAVALAAALGSATGCASGVRHDAALTAKARSAIMSTCGGDMVEGVTADAGGLVLVRLSVKSEDAGVAKAIAGVTADIIFKGVPDVRSVAVRDSADSMIEVFSRNASASDAEGREAQLSVPCYTGSGSLGR